MIKRTSIIIGAILVVVLAIGLFWYFSESQKHPVPNVTIDGKSIPITEGSYCWEGTFSAECVDKVYSGPIEMGQQNEPTEIAADQAIKINFDKEPIKDSIKVEKWEEDGSHKKVELKNSEVIPPEERGVYYYYITAGWERGDGSYAFSVEVK